MDVNLILHLIPLMVGTDLLAHPELQGAALEDRIDGDVRHAARVALGPAGFLIDFVWDYAPLHDQFRAAIHNELVRALAQMGSAAAPAAPATDPATAVQEQAHV